MRKIFLNSMFVLAAAAMVSCGSKQTAKQSVAEEVVVLPKVEVQSVASRVVSQEATFTGTVEAQVVNNIAPQQPLRIKEIRFDVGDHVKKGDLLYSLQSPDIMEQQAEVIKINAEIGQTFDNLSADICVIFANTTCEYQHIYTIQRCCVCADIFLNAINKHSTSEICTFVSLFYCIIDVAGITGYATYTH